jgi:hypothetical protein
MWMQTEIQEKKERKHLLFNTAESHNCHFSQVSGHTLLSNKWRWRLNANPVGMSYSVYWDNKWSGRRQRNMYNLVMARSKRFFLLLNISLLFCHIQTQLMWRDDVKCVAKIWAIFKIHG